LAQRPAGWRQWGLNPVQQPRACPLWGAGLRFCLAAALLLAVAQGQERLRAVAVVNTLLALAGVAIISQGSVGASVPLASLVVVVASAVCIAQAAVLVRRFPPVHPVTMNAVGMTTGAALTRRLSGTSRSSTPGLDRRSAAKRPPSATPR
jgi:drug/metabolite transporter (DMT)-like permease